MHNSQAAQQCPVTTVTENESVCSKREVAQAREARQLQKRMAKPPDAKLIKAIVYPIGCAIVISIASTLQ